MRRRLTRLSAEHAQLQNRLDQMYVDKLDGKIGESFYERKSSEWRAEQDRIMEAIQRHRSADRSYADTGINLLRLARPTTSSSVREVRRSASCCS